MGTPLGLAAGDPGLADRRDARGGAQSGDAAAAARADVTPGLVSVLILNLNGARFLQACLDAVQAQDYRPLEDWTTGLAASVLDLKLLAPDHCGNE